MRSIIAIAVFSMLLLQACYYDKEEILYLKEQLCDTVGTSYTAKVSPIITGNCLGCHGTGVNATMGGNLNLEGYTNISVPAKNGMLLKSINHEPDVSPMPKGSPKLSSCDLLTIQNWVNSGAPNN